MPQTMDRNTVRSWMAELQALEERVAMRFSRAEPRRRMKTYLRGLLGSAERKNSWQLAEAAGESTPYAASNTFFGQGRLGRRSRARRPEGLRRRASRR